MEQEFNLENALAANSETARFRERLSSTQVEKLSLFYELIIHENTVQNLTRLTNPEDFVRGHLLDVFWLGEIAEFRERSDKSSQASPLLDLGSGPGVPGLAAAIMFGGHWVLAESEQRKADFLSRAVSTLKMSDVRVFPGRAEDFLKKNQTSVSAVVSRAAGKVDRILSWISNCSTWNTLFLLKGPGWEAESDEKITDELRAQFDFRICGDFGADSENKRTIFVQITRKE